MVPVDLPTLLAEIKKRLSVHGLEAIDVMDDVDPQRVGRISRAQFQRLLTSRVVQFTAREITPLLAEFANPENPNEIEGSRFLKSVENPGAVDAPAPDCSAALSVLRRHLVQRHIELSDLMRPFDKLRRGAVTPPDFLRAVGNSKEASQIAQTFTRKSDGLIPYLEVAAALVRLAPAQSEIPEIPKVVPWTLQQLVEGHVDLRPVFLRFDRLSRGALPSDQFRAALLSTGIRLSPAECIALSEYYNIRGTVSYLKLLADLRDFEAQRSRRPAAALPSDKDVDELLERLRDDCARRKIWIGDLFSHFDSDQIGKYAFQKVLASARFPLTAEDLAFLSTTFSISEGVVSLPSFLSTFEQRRRTRRVHDSIDTLTKIRNFLSARQMAISSHLSIYERQHGDDFPVDLLTTAFGRLGLALVPADLDSIRVLFPGAADNTVKWREFASAVDPVFDAKQRGETPPHGESREIPAVVAPALKLINDFCRCNGVKLFDEFRARDRRRTGRLPSSAFMQTMTVLFPRFPVAELRNVIGYYGETEFNYIELCKDVSEVPGVMTTPPPSDALGIS
jgi:Ca2+-binding EF-hand superfamily protein